MEEIDKSKLEQKEKLPISIETLKTDSLIDLIYKGNKLPEDNRFLTTEEGGVFKYFELKDIQNHKEDRFFSIIKVDEKIVGLSELLKDPFNNRNLWIQFLSIDPKEQGKGYASKLAKEIFDFAKEKGYSLEASRYTEQGMLKMRSVFEKLSGEYPEVVFINKEKL
ncbi:MAG: GNAT family N-acetyltransferase [Candidatus Nomurabacteria bacterium]